MCVCVCCVCEHVCVCVLWRGAASISSLVNSCMVLCIYIISRNGPYISGHLAFYFKLNFKFYNVL